MKILCISTFYKGLAFIEEAHKLGNTIYLLTNKKLENSDWPIDSIAEFFYLENVENSLETYQTIISGMGDIMRRNKIDLIVALDDFDVEKAAIVREEFRIPGMGQTTSRYFRDKLAMRLRAKDEGVLVPSFTAVFHDQDVTDFLQNTEGPWVIKPRSEASATGIKKVNNFQEAWDQINALGDHRRDYLIEKFTPGDVYHVDSVVHNGHLVFTSCSQYLSTPFEVAHGGGIFRSITVDYGGEDRKKLERVNLEVMKAFGMKYSASHTEVIKAHDGSGYYFLETASRVGGAHLAEKVEAATGVNLWQEWAKIENATFSNEKYKAPKSKKDHAGIIITLSSQKHPDYSLFDAPEVVWTMTDEYHVGLIVKSPKRERVLELLEEYAQKIYELGLHASAPAPDSSTH